MSVSSRCSKASSSSDWNMLAWSSAPSACRVLLMLSRRRRKKPWRRGSPSSAAGDAAGAAEPVSKSSCHLRAIAAQDIAGLASVLVSTRGWLVTVLCAAVIGLGSAALLEGGDEAPAAPPRGVLLTLPELVRLSWRCDDSMRFSTTRRAHRAPLFATLDAGGMRVFSHRQVEPVAGGELSSPFTRARSHVWRIRDDHEPATIRAIVRVRFGVTSAGHCFASRLVNGARTWPH